MECCPPGSSVHGILQVRIQSGLPFPSPGNLPNPGIKPRSPALQADSVLTELQGKPMKRLSQSGKDAQLWMCLAVKLKSDAIRKQYCIGTWNVRSMNHGKLEVVKQEMARMNINNLRISELKWTRMGEFNSDDHYIYSLEEMEQPL